MTFENEVTYIFEIILLTFSKGDENTKLQFSIWLGFLDSARVCFPRVFPPKITRAPTETSCIPYLGSFPFSRGDHEVAAVVDLFYFFIICRVSVIEILALGGVRFEWLLTIWTTIYVYSSDSKPLFEVEFFVIMPICECEF